jgi:hypothetical protein
MKGFISFEAHESKDLPVMYRRVRLSVFQEQIQEALKHHRNSTSALLTWAPKSHSM